MAKPYKKTEIIEWCGYLTNSFNRFLRRPLLNHDVSADKVAKALYDHQSVILSHRFEDVPRFCFANAAAQQVFGYSWDEFMGMPSTQSAEADAQEDRNRLLERANKVGFIDDYAGIRIRKDGARFKIQNVIFWNIQNLNQERVGQVAMFSDITPLDRSTNLSCG